jgi:large subunit ribosomal protein L17
MLRNQATALLRYEHLTTTVPRAKELRPFVERLITVAKRGLAAGTANAKELNARRLVMVDLQDREIVSKLFDTLAPRFADRPGGYTRLCAWIPLRRQCGGRPGRARRRVRPTREGQGRRQGRGG